MTEKQWFHRRGQTARGGWETVVDVTTPDWSHTGLRVAALRHGESVTLGETGEERIVVPLAGSFDVRVDASGTTTTFALAGRESVFAGPTDVLYVSSDSTLVISGTGRVAVATSPTTDVRPTRYIPTTEIPIELRGAGTSSRQVHNFGTPQSLDAARLIVCEVITPAGNWSSYPPHKHDENVPGHESRLEEIYYFESAPTNAGASAATREAAFGMFSTYSSAAGEIHIDHMVHSGDVALVPFGYHGPAVAAPGYDLYYLNVMAGPDADRAWLISDDPAHAWVRTSWDGEEIDSRLPFANEKKDTP